MPTGEMSQLSPPRTKGTPSGYRNVRVLVPRDLHFRLLAYASQSHLSMPAFVAAWLDMATPLEPPANPSGCPQVNKPAPGHRPARGKQNEPGLAGGPGAAHGQQTPSPGHRPAANVPLDVPRVAVGTCAAPSSAATATSAVSLNREAALSGSSTTNAPARSTSIRDNDAAKAVRTDPR